jgi:hypothetical protein
MKVLCTGLVVASLSSSVAIAQVPTQPSGTMRVEADHREFVSQVRTLEWRAPASGIEGFTTYFPDGLYVTTVKLKDGAQVHDVGSYRINGDVFCQKARMPADSKETCTVNYRTGDNAFESWRSDGRFSVHWNLRVKK